MVESESAQKLCGREKLMMHQEPSWEPPEHHVPLGFVLSASNTGAVFRQ